MLNSMTVRRTLPRQRGELLTDADLEGVAVAVWKGLLRSSLYRARRLAPSSYAVSATVSLVGDCSAIAMISVPEAVAISASVGVLGLQVDELAPGDIDDAFAVLALAVGDAIAALLPGGAALGHPSVAQGERLTTALPGARLTAETLLWSGAGPVRVSLWRPRSRGWPAAG